MAQGVQVGLAVGAADAALVLGIAAVQAGGLLAGARDLHPVVLVLVRGEQRSQHHAASVRVGGHRKGQTGAAAGRAQRRRPARKLPAGIRHCRDGGAGAALFDQLAGAALQRSAGGGHKLHGDFCAPHRDGVLADQAHRRAGRLRDVPQRLGPAVLGDIGMGAHILKKGGDRRFGQVHPIRQGIVLFGPAGVRVFQHLGAVQKLKAVFLAHFGQGGVVGVHLHHVQVLVFALFVQRRDGVDDDVGVGPGLPDGFQPFQVGLDKAVRVGGLAGQVVGAKADDDALGLEHGHRVGDGVHLAVAHKLLAFQGGDGPRAHADHADVVGQRGKGLAGLVGVHHVAGGVGVADEQRLVHVAAAGVGGLGQDGAGLGNDGLGFGRGAGVGVGGLGGGSLGCGGFRRFAAGGILPLAAGQQQTAGQRQGGQAAGQAGRSDKGHGGWTSLQKIGIQNCGRLNYKK